MAESLLAMGWSIRFHPAALFTVRIKDQPIDCLGLSMGPDGISGFSSREAAVAWILRYLDARIVDTVADLSAVAPTCFVELTEDSHG